VKENASPARTAPAQPRKRESIDEFKAKLVRLEKNKGDLEAKMKEFEQKIQQTAQRINY